jgi:hypothetical protein
MFEVGPPPIRSWPDYRNLDQYRLMLELDRAGWAWEWLRRSQDYEQACGDQPAVAERQALDTLSGGVVLRSASTCLSAWGVCFCRVAGPSCHSSASPLGRAP